MWGVPKKEFRFLLIGFLLANGGMFFILNAVYWDDWTLLNSRASLIEKNFADAGSFLNLGYYLHYYMLQVGPWFYKVATLILNFFSGILIFRILSRNEWIAKSERFLITLFFLISPLFIAKVVMIDFPYSLGLFSFLLAWHLIGRVRVLSLVLFFFSFCLLPSLLVFYALPVLDYYLSQQGAFTPSKVLRWASTKIDFISLPFIQFVIKTRYFSPSELYSGYNENFNPVNFIQSINGVVSDFLALDINFILLAICFVSVLLLILKVGLKTEDGKSSRKMLFITLLILFLGYFPYGILGYSPQFADWNSRHQVLLQIGASFLLTTIILSGPFNFRISLFAFLVGICLAVNIKNYFDLFVDWNKQKQIMAIMYSSDQIRNGNAIVFHDHTKTRNALNRTYRDYEWNGLMKRAYGDEKRYGMDNGIAYLEYTNGRSDRFFTPSYNAGSHRRDSINKVTSVDIFLERGIRYYFLINGQKVYGDYSVSSSFYKTVGMLIP